MGKNSVTYLIGAGASAEAIPVVGADFNTKFILFCDMLLHYSKKWYPNAEKHRAFITQATVEVPRHYSVDTYARKLYFNGKEVYLAFKILLSYYFIFEQTERGVKDDGIQDQELGLRLAKAYPYQRKALDPRYDVIYAALLDERDKTLPSNINIISWNYDVQFELSYSRFLNVELDDAFSNLRVFPSVSSFNLKTDQSFQFIKLNGTGGLIYHRGSEKQPSGYEFLNSKKNDWRAIAEACLNNIRNALDAQVPLLDCILHFAWEQDPNVKQARRLAQKIISETSILVTIGYSFPLYNRRIDREIFQLIKGIPVYVQVPSNHFERTAERLKTVLPDLRRTNIVTGIGDTDQFFIPDEII